MKKHILLFLSIFALAFASCGSGEAGNEQEPDESKLEVTPELLTFAAQGAESQTVTVTAENVQWDVKLNDDTVTWLHFEKRDNTVSVTVDDNISADPRETKFAIVSTDESKSVDVTVKQAGMEGLQKILHATGRFMGDYFGVGVSNYDLDMYTSDFDEKGGRTGDGYRIMVDFFSEDPADEKRPEIASGTYVVNDSKEKFTVIPGGKAENGEDWQHTILIEVKDGVYTDKVLTVTGGTMEVTNHGDVTAKYSIMCKFTLSDGTEFNALYSGPVRVSNPALGSTLTGDYDVETPFTNGQVSFFGDPGNGTYRYIIAMYGADYNPYYGLHETVAIEVYTTKTGPGNVVPPGTYTIEDGSAAGSCMPGWLDGTYYKASWYRKLENGNAIERAPLVSGEVVIKYDAQTEVYDIEVDALDSESDGYRVTAHMNGTMRYYSPI